MSLRDRAFSGYDTVYLLSPINGATLQALPAAVKAAAAREGMQASAGLERLPDSAGDAALIAAARGLRQPFGLAIAGDRVAVYLPHERADGVEGTRMLSELLVPGSAGRTALPVRSVRAPLLRAVRAGGWRAVRAYLQGRAERRAIPAPSGPAAQGAGHFIRLTLDAHELAAIRRTRSAGGRATVMSRVGSIVISSLAALADPSLDVRVVIPVDLRHLVGGRRVAGNFVSAETYGTLRTTDWSPGSLSRMLAARRGTAAVALLAGTVRALLRSSTGGPASAPTLSISLMGAIALPDAPWDGAAPSLGCATIGPTPGTFVFVAQVGDAVTVSVWDDTGAFDVPRFPEAFRSEVARRSPD